jgi:hypothetical protein|tara:strand:+ start:508 stop:1383 length:876 start_codon:yes stop_codon:yes gene_type:complete
MSILVHEKFEDGWQDSWKGNVHHAYKTAGDALRLMFREGNHYGCALYREVPPSRHVKMSYMVRALSNWNSDSTGKTLGFADLRYKNARGQSYGHGNRQPAPDGFSFRTWFGKSKEGYMPIGMYFYHLGQVPRWGDSVKVGQLKIGGNAVLFECEADFDEGFIRARVDGGEWVRHNLVVTDKTAVTWAWLDAYYGGPAVSPENMAWDISDYKLENLGADLGDPGIDWDAIARMIAEKEEAAKETAESEEDIEEVVLSGPADHGLQSISDGSLIQDLRDLADKLEALEAGKVN